MSEIAKWFGVGGVVAFILCGAATVVFPEQRSDLLPVAGLAWLMAALGFGTFGYVKLKQQNADHSFGIRMLFLAFLVVAVPGIANGFIVELPVWLLSVGKWVGGILFVVGSAFHFLAVGVGVGRR